MIDGTADRFNRVIVLLVHCLLLPPLCSWGSGWLVFGPEFKE